MLETSSNRLFAHDLGAVPDLLIENKVIPIT